MQEWQKIDWMNKAGANRDAIKLLMKEGVTPDLSMLGVVSLMEYGLHNLKINPNRNRDVSGQLEALTTWEPDAVMKTLEIDRDSLKGKTIKQAAWTLLDSLNIYMIARD